jgi:hypothetical protein
VSAHSKEVQAKCGAKIVGIAGAGAQVVCGLGHDVLESSSASDLQQSG